MANTIAGASGYALPTYPFVAPPDLAAVTPRRYPVVIVGAGLAGLTAACDFAVRGIDTIVLDEDDTVGVRGFSSRGICYAQKSLEIFARLGVYERIVEKGVQWSRGRTFAGRDEVYAFDLAVDSVSKQPPFINIQQFYIEWFLVDRILELGRTQLRWKNRVSSVRQSADGAELTVHTPAGEYRLAADWVLDCTGANSNLREQLCVPSDVARGQDRWCISDVRFKQQWPMERWTYVEAPFNQNRAVWQHPMADDVWRLDYQMDANADPETVSRAEVVNERLREQLGSDTEYELVWVGPYAYRTQLLADFRAGRVFFVGDSAHVVSPFGARGGNSGIQDAENLVWKLALCMTGKAPLTLLDSYTTERRAAALHNIQVTSRTNRFLSPQSAAEKTLRDAVIALAKEFSFARQLVNTGRMSLPYSYSASPLTTSGGQHIQNASFRGADGAVMQLTELFKEGSKFVGLCFDDTTSAGDHELLTVWSVAQALGSGRALSDDDGRLRHALGARQGDFCLLRPDMHLAAKLQRPDRPTLRRALEKALGA